MAVRAFLDLGDGMAILIGPAGLLVGRHSSCNLQLTAGSASRRHALFRVADASVELIVLGKRSVDVDGQPISTTASLAHGARVELPGLTARIRIDEVAHSIPPALALCRGPQRFPITTSPFILGGDPSASIAIDGWPANALQLWVTRGEVSAELEDGTQLPVPIGEPFVVRGETFRVERTLADDVSTVLVEGQRKLRAVRMQALPRGGRVTFQFGDGEETVYLPGRRYRLVSALLVPPAPFAPGDFVPDSEVIPTIWDDTDEVGGRIEINIVIARTRKDLIAAGLPSVRLLERAPGGRATRFAVDRDTTVEIID